MAGMFVTIGAAIDLCKKAGEAALKVRDAELKNLIGDLSLNLAHLKTQLADMQEENLRLKKELQEKAASANAQPNLELRDSAYYFKGPQDDRPAGPYCTRCFDVDKTLVLLSEVTRQFKVLGKYKCNNCKGHFGH
jgi:hypothetical protein